ncbi:MAG: prepilin-type N-terminal cleavage/methylation domain-containing protein [Nitrospirae bacterium]|nr:prepilin-type N-terminal cleavage/methylation domain-containing protein [Nitrospirota bacterium]
MMRSLFLSDKQDSNKGFTLIEMMIVVTLVTVGAV